MKKGVICMKNDEVCCPHCGSTQIVANKKGFGLGKAVAGGLLLRTRWTTWRNALK